MKPYYENLIDKAAYAFAALVLIALAAIWSTDSHAQTSDRTTPGLSDTIPSEATGLYEGGGWRCTVLAFKRDLNRPDGLPPIKSPSLEWDCNNSTNRYVGYIASGDGTACPQRPFWGYLLGFDPPPGGLKGELSIVGYSPSAPGSIVFEFRLYPSALPQQIQLTRVQTIASPAPYSCTTVTAKPKRGR